MAYPLEVGDGVVVPNKNLVLVVIFRTGVGPSTMCVTTIKLPTIKNHLYKHTS